MQKKNKYKAIHSTRGTASGMRGARSRTTEILSAKNFYDSSCVKFNVSWSAKFDSNKEPQWKRISVNDKKSQQKSPKHSRTAWATNDTIEKQQKQTKKLLIRRQHDSTYLVQCPP